MSLTVSNIKKARRREWVAIPAWTPEGEAHDPARHGVYVGAMGARAILAYEDEIHSRVGDPGSPDKMPPESRAEVLAIIVTFTAQHEDGSALFSQDDVAWLVNEPIEALSAITDVGIRLSGLTKTAAVERSKNSDAGTGSNSLSGSPAISA